MPANQSPGNETRSSKYPNLIVLVVLQLILFIIITLSYSLSPFAEQQISSNCAVINSKTGTRISNIHYFLFDGISTSEKQCINSKTDFWYEFESYE